ncbi:MAG: hypothetical protein QOI68_140, partial [Pseudonocardiales bacterium]|nr:hypothetical protein [Pseudonocardiales bacterium]
IEPAELDGAVEALRRSLKDLASS